MTPKQTALYWREWQSVHRRYPDVDRHDLTIRALGTDKSSKTFTNADLDRVLAEFRALTQPDSLAAQLKQASMAKTRLLWKINQYQTPLLAIYISHPSHSSHQAAESYIAAIAQDKFHRPLWELSATELEMLRNTLAARLQSLRKAAGHTIKEMHQLAGLALPGVRPSSGAAPTACAQPA